jgi:hypothetical protein
MPKEAAAPQVRYKTITPEEAHVILRRSKRKNVPVKKRKIDQYARDMINDKWDPFNSQAVSIDTDGNIVNGHQRLMACVQAGKPFRTLFVTGVPPATFKNEDTGRTRDAGHFFAVAGEKYYIELAAGARGLYAWEGGNWRGAAKTSGGGNVYVPYDDLQDEVERRPQLREAAAFGNRYKNAFSGRLKTGMVVALHALTQGHEHHAEFWKELADRLSVDKESPAWQLNRRIDQIKARGGHLSSVNLLALMTKAWNSYAKGEWTRLSWDPDKEKFPTPVTSLVPELVVADDASEVITTTPRTRGRRVKPPAGPVELKVVPVPTKKPRKGKKLRGGLDTAAG